MENLTQDSAPSFPPNKPDTRISAMCQAVAGGLTIRVAIEAVFGSKHEYYTRVSIQDRLVVRRLSQRTRVDEQASGLVRMSVSMERDRQKAMLERVDQLSIERGRPISASEYIVSLIAADLRTINSD